MVRIHPRPVLPQPNERFKSSAPAVVVQCWCRLVERMDRRTLNRFTKDMWARFDERELGSLKQAIIRRREELSREQNRQHAVRQPNVAVAGAVS